MQTFISVETVRFHLEDKNKLIVQYVYRGDEPADNKVHFGFDKENVEASIEEYSGFNIRQRYYAKYGKYISSEYYATIKMPDNYENYGKFIVSVSNSEETVDACVISISDLEKMKHSVDCCFDRVTVNKNDEFKANGWYASDKEPVIKVTDNKGQELKAEISYSYRQDIIQIYKELEKDDYKFGFEIRVPECKVENVNITIQCGNAVVSNQFNVKDIKRQSTIRPKKNVDIKVLSKKAYRYAKNYGIKETVKKIYSKLNKKGEASVIDYTEYVKKHQPNKETLMAQRKERFAYEPVFSIIIPLYKTNEKFLAELLDSILAQTYGKFEVCLSDGSGDKTILKDILEEYSKKDSRIKYNQLDKAAQISENTNNALKLVTGDYIVLCDHDDLIPEYTLYECVKKINEEKKVDIIYSDEDKVDMDGERYFEPHFKPDFNIDLLRSANYICHLFVVKKDIVDKIGEFRSEFDGSQDYDFIFRCVEQTEPAYIYHIPKVLYHWRAHIDSTAENPESKLYAFEAGKRAINAHLERMNIKGYATDGAFYGVYRTHYDVTGEPLISIVIPNKDHIDDLNKCMQSIITKSSYKNYEFIIVENNSVLPETFEFYKKIESEYDNVKVIYWKDEFNYSAINNFGVKEAKGEYILLLNNDTEIINEDCLAEMLAVCQRDDVGIVGARLYYEDDTIQHAGVIIGIGGIAGHAFVGQPRHLPGYFARAMCTQDYSAVTAACMMTKKSIFEAVGGLTEEFKVAFNDIDYCMKVRKLGKLVVYNAFAELYHYESKSRGLEDTPEKVARFNSEMYLFRDRWCDILEKGDPYYNPNLTLDKSDFSLREY